MKQLLEYWPVLIVMGQVMTVWLVFWMRTESKRAADAAVEPVKEAVRILADRVLVLETWRTDTEGDIGKLPTKADLEQLAGKVDGAHREAAAASAGVGRIEGMLLERGMAR